MEQNTLNPGSKSMHVDQFIDTHPSSELLAKEPEINYARFVLNNFRLPASLLIDFEPFIKEYKLFCFSNIEGYQGKKLQVVFASRMGWVGVREVYSNHHSYENSIPIDSCFGWTSK